MAIGGRGITVKVDERAVKAFIDLHGGPVTQKLGRAGEIVAQGQKLRAPTSPRGSGGRPSGYLRSSIGWELLTDEQGDPFVRIGSHAITDDGTDYGLLVEIGTAPHDIEPRNAKALRWFGRDGNPIFATVVHHPGTRPQPYLVPALDDLKGKRL